jgi:hypothetical protein
MFERSASVSTVTVINLPKWNLALIKSGSLARVLAADGVGEEDFPAEAEHGHH